MREASATNRRGNQELRHVANGIEGFLDTDEPILLYEKARNLPPDSVIVEIGSYKGKSTVLLALGLRDGNGGRVYAIDPHVGSVEHKRDGKVGIKRKDIR